MLNFNNITKVMNFITFLISACAVFISFLKSSKNLFLKHFLVSIQALRYAGISGHFPDSRPIQEPVAIKLKNRISQDFFCRSFDVSTGFSISFSATGISHTARTTKPPAAITKARKTREKSIFCIIQLFILTQVPTQLVRHPISIYLIT